MIGLIPSLWFVLTLRTGPRPPDYAVLLRTNVVQSAESWGIPALPAVDGTSHLCGLVYSGGVSRLESPLLSYRLVH